MIKINYFIKTILLKFINNFGYLLLIYKNNKIFFNIILAIFINLSIFKQNIVFKI